MSTDLPSFLGGEEDDAVDAQAPAAESQAPVEPANGPARGPDGKFVPADASAQAPQDTATAAPAAAAAPEPVKPPDGFVPVSVVQALREEVRALRNPIPPRVVPDPDEDPDGYADFERSQLHESVLSNKLDISQEMATEKFGEERVAAAFEWFKTQPPERRQEIMAHRHPYGYAVQQAEAAHEQQTQSALTPDEIADFRAWRSSQGQGGTPAPLQQPAAQAASPAPVAPRPSLAAAPSTGGPSAAPVLDGEATFQKMFAR